MFVEVNEPQQKQLSLVGDLDFESSLRDGVTVRQPSEPVLFKVR